MRTTLIINDELVAAAKRLAAERRTNVSQVVCDALRRELDVSGSRAPSFSLPIPVYGGGGSGTVDTTPAEFDALRHDEFVGNR
jgi:hypothetical protein